MNDYSAQLPPVRHSLSRRFLLVLAGIFLLTYLSVAATIFGSISQYLAESIQSRLTQTAADSVEKCHDVFSRQLIDVQAWAALEVMNDLITGDIDGRIGRTLVQLKKQYTLPDHIYVFDNSGKLIASSREETLPQPTVIPPEWHNNNRGAYFVDKHSTPLLTGAGLAFGINVYASFNPELLLGTLVIAYPWRSVETMMNNRASPLLILADNNDALLYSSPKLPALNGNNLKALRLADKEINLLKNSLLVGIAFTATANNPAFPHWTIMALSPREQALQPIRDAAMQILLLGLGIAIPIMLIMLWQARRLVQPIISLTHTVADITFSADLSKRVQVNSGDELGVLGHAFNAMTTKLQSSVEELAQLNRTLEQKVVDRTTALQSANAELQSTIDQLQSAQSQLVQQEKMASLGQLVAGVAHELNNPIGAIYANLPILEEYVRDLIELIVDLEQMSLTDIQKQLLQKKLAHIDFEFVREDSISLIGSCKNAALRVKDIVVSLRNFSRLDEAELKDVLLEDGLDSTLALLYHTTRNRIEIKKHYGLKKPVRCHAGQINQVFMNLLSNAIHAISNKGIIQISTLCQDDYAVVIIYDTGCGMSPETLKKIFDPFFTTKKIGEGTGLGLSISYNIIEKHHGQFTVESDPDYGTCFTLKLPFTQPANEQ
jgi:signal transduction histidine kinase